MADAAFPVLFSAHGNPMNAVRENPFTRFLSSWAESFPRPRALIVVSAHWESRPCRVNLSAQPGLLYDFYGFPGELYKVKYPAPGDPDLAEAVLDRLEENGLEAVPEVQRGLDHGVWSPLSRIFPRAEIPVVQVSLPPAESPAAALALGEALSSFRNEDCLILASGNLVHNLGTADFHRPLAPSESWAVEFDGWARDRLLQGDLESLCSFKGVDVLARRAHPSLEHYSPLLAAAGAGGPEAKVSFPFEGFEHGTISMRCVRFD